MTEKFLARVPRHIWEEGRPSGARRWHGEFNIASWLQLTGKGGRVELLIRHSDEAGEHLTSVDQSLVAGQESVLLAGLVRLDFQGEVEQLQVSVRLAQPDMGFQVDELFMQRRDSALGRDEKLISNF